MSEQRHPSMTNRRHYCFCYSASEMKFQNAFIALCVLWCNRVQGVRWFFGGRVTTGPTQQQLSSSSDKSPKHPTADISSPKVYKHKTKSKAAGYHIITDIDDTVVSSGGKKFGIKLGGIDDQFKRGQFYPGVIQFALELATARPKVPKVSKEKDSLQSEDPGVVTPSKISVLTARAKELKFAMSLKPRGKLCSKYHNHGTLKGLPGWGIGEVHYGSVAEWVMHWRRGWRKFKNFERMLLRDTKAGRDTKYIFIGDTGDRDEDAAERMALGCPDSLKAVFLHNVYATKGMHSPSANKHPRRSTTTAAGSAYPLTIGAYASSQPNQHHSLQVQEHQQQQQRQDRTVNGVPIFYFRTYIGAAAKAYKAGLIGQEAVKRVAAQAVLDLQQQDLQEQLMQQQKQKQKQKQQNYGGRRVSITSINNSSRKQLRRLLKLSSSAPPSVASITPADASAVAGKVGKLGKELVGIRAASHDASQSLKSRSVGGIPASSGGIVVVQGLEQSRSKDKWDDLRKDALLCRFLTGYVPKF